MVGPFHAEIYYKINTHESDVSYSIYRFIVYEKHRNNGFVSNLVHH